MSNLAQLLVDNPMPLSFNNTEADYYTPSGMFQGVLKVDIEGVGKMGDVIKGEFTEIGIPNGILAPKTGLKYNGIKVEASKLDDFKPVSLPTVPVPISTSASEALKHVKQAEALAGTNDQAIKPSEKEAANYLKNNQYIPLLLIVTGIVVLTVFIYKKLS
jgi:hypothetical protein